MNCFSEEQKSRISYLVREIEKLTDVEKLFLYLQLPCGRADATDVGSKSQRFNGGATAGGIQKSLDLFSKKPDQETTQTYTWILSHLEIDPNVSLPKQEVYDEYRAFCQANRFEPLCVADFGKAMKHAFPCIKPRRLGQRGNSRYCYSGLRKKYKIQPPNLPDIGNGDEQAVMYCTLTNCNQTNNNNNTPATSNAGSADHHNSNNNSLNNNNNFNGNNMTTIKSSNNDAEINNKTRIYNPRPEVMNLKIEPNNLHHQQQPTNHDPNGSGSALIQFNEDPSSKQQQVYSFHADDIGQSLNRSHHQPILGSSLQQSATTSSETTYDNHELGLHLSHHGRYTDYSSRTIQQPGTPDDDDYRHNYQDMLPMSGRFLNSSTNTQQHTLAPTHNPSQNPQTIPLTTSVNVSSNSSSSIGGSGSSAINNFGYNTQHHHNPFGPMAATTTTLTSTDGQHSSMMQTNDCKYISHVLQSQAPFNNSVNLVPASSSGVQTRPLLQAGPSSGNINHQMTVAHMDACASPFQSPASTPYPSMSGNYPIQDMMQECYTNGCRL